MGLSVYAEPARYFAYGLVPAGRAVWRFETVGPGGPGGPGGGDDGEDDEPDDRWKIVALVGLAVVVLALIIGGLIVGSGDDDGATPPRASSSTSTSSTSTSSTSTTSTSTTTTSSTTTTTAHHDDRGGLPGAASPRRGGEPVQRLDRRRRGQRRPVRRPRGGADAVLARRRGQRPHLRRASAAGGGFDCTTATLTEVVVFEVDPVPSGYRVTGASFPTTDLGRPAAGGTGRRHFWLRMRDVAVEAARTGRDISGRGPPPSSRVPSLVPSVVSRQLPASLVH